FKPGTPGGLALDDLQRHEATIGRRLWLPPIGARTSQGEDVVVAFDLHLARLAGESSRAGRRDQREDQMAVFDSIAGLEEKRVTALRPREEEVVSAVHHDRRLGEQRFVVGGEPRTETPAERDTPRKEQKGNSDDSGGAAKRHQEDRNRW